MNAAWHSPGIHALWAFTGYEARVGFRINGIHAVWHEPGAGTPQNRTYRERAYLGFQLSSNTVNPAIVPIHSRRCRQAHNQITYHNHRKHRYGLPCLEHHRVPNAEDIWKTDSNR